MGIVGFNYTSILAEKKGSTAEKVKISNHVKIEDIAPAEVNFGSDKEETLKFTYEFCSKYEPDIGGIVIKGDILMLEQKDKTSEIKKDWKEKKVKKELMIKLINSVLRKCNVKALVLSQDIHIPPPIKLPLAKGVESN